jgi:hypothetical protein
MAVKLYVLGKLRGEFESRSMAIVACFENNLVYDQHSRKRNQLLPSVNIVEDKEDKDGYA